MVMLLIAWIVVGCYFTLNLFVGVVVDNFSMIKAETDGSATMTAEQQQWVHTITAIANQRPQVHSLPPLLPLQAPFPCVSISVHAQRRVRCFSHLLSAVRRSFHLLSAVWPLACRWS